jgi:hypothetical protein
MIASACMASILAVGSYVGIDKFHLNVYQAWAFITVWVWLIAVVYVMRYRSGKWRSMRVIDQVHHSPKPLAQETPSANGQSYADTAEASSAAVEPA